MGIRFELGELTGVAGRPSQTRRIAELSGLLHDDEVARAWWVKVPEAGDQDAADHLRKLFFEQRKQGPGGWTRQGKPSSMDAGKVYLMLCRLF